MGPPASDYLHVGSTQYALEALACAGEDARVLAEGQPLTAALSMRLAQSQLLVDISRTHNLNTVRVEDDYLGVSVAATQGNAGWRPSLINEVPLLTLAFPHTSHFQIRDRDMVCGSIARADPSVELPLVLAAFDGQVALRSLRCRRVMQATGFFQGVPTATREPDEPVEAVRFPLQQPGARYGFAEFSARRGGFALMACAAIVADDVATLAVGGVADRPVFKRWPCL